MVNIHIHQFQPAGAVIDEAALEQFRRRWATYQKLVDADQISHKAVGSLLHDTLIQTFDLVQPVDPSPRHCLEASPDAGDQECDRHPPHAVRADAERWRDARPIFAALPQGQPAALDHARAGRMGTDSTITSPPATFPRRNKDGSASALKQGLLAPVSCSRNPTGFYRVFRYDR